ncbi:hypothetical protein HOF65_01095 [bacterium]|nr:hypothetical protein [bacterium]MBT3852636.1 hypothetical protein [bacterium]MBT4633413.1 hypothetical protein [bacterium]MBT6778834.1 hypothetical protein [bacterium]
MSYTVVNIILSTVVQIDSRVQYIFKSTPDQSLTTVPGNNLSFFQAARVESLSTYILNVIVSSVQEISK